MSLLIILLTIILLPVLYHIFVPLKYPDLTDYFNLGQTFTSRAEGVTQKVIRLEGDKFYSQITVNPGCPGPPEHVHLSMDETATVTKGTLTYKVDGKSGQLEEGERLILQRAHYHTFSNPTDQIVEITCIEAGDYVSLEFAYCLTKIYSIMDSNSRFKTLKLFLQLSILHDWFDNYIAGPPIYVQNALRLTLRPYARVLGFSP